MTAMKFSTNRPYANPEAAARKLIELASGGTKHGSLMLGRGVITALALRPVWRGESQVKIAKISET
jgi:hypothetical protein